jgi:hypothetical protein
VPRAAGPWITGDTGVYYLQDIYGGEGLEGSRHHPSFRVVALEYRAAGIGEPQLRGRGPSALPWRRERLGCQGRPGRPGYEDGSAAFVPARTPVYFQALDERGYALQTMRSWSTLQPGERASCALPPPRPARRRRARLPRLGAAGGPRPAPAAAGSASPEVQPILDRR